MKINTVNLIKLVIIISFSTFLSIIFRDLGFHESNFILIYVLGVLFVSKNTDGYIFGVIASLLAVLSFNFFFTEPYYSLRVYREDYPLTFFVMLFVAIITSMQTTKLKKEMKKSIDREKNIQILYDLNRGLLQVKNKQDLIDFSAKNISKIFSRSILMAIINEDTIFEKETICPYEGDLNVSIFKIHSEREILKKTILSKKEMGFGTGYLTESSVLYIPILKNNKCMGVIGILCLDKKRFTLEEKSMLDAIITLLNMAIDKELLYEKQKNTNLEIEKERLRANLLRSISHDLRTPLTSIMGSVSTLIENDKLINSEIRAELLQNVLDDASWLINSSENILSMTKIEEGKLVLNKNNELISEIISEVMTRTKKILKNHKFSLNIQEEDSFINTDALLIIQLLFNLIENAVKYTDEDSKIGLSCYSKDSMICFEVSDNGKGIPQEDLTKIFDRFYRSNINAKPEKRGLGLGLTICKSIAKAHGGALEAYNNETGGATFKLTLEKGKGELNGNKTLDFNCGG